MILLFIYIIYILYTSTELCDDVAWLANSQSQTYLLWEINNDKSVLGHFSVMSRSLSTQVRRHSWLSEWYQWDQHLPLNVQGILHRKHAYILGTARQRRLSEVLESISDEQGLETSEAEGTDVFFLCFWEIWRYHKPWQFEMILGRFQDFSYCSWVAKILKQIWTLARPDPNVSRNFLTFNLII